MMDWTAYIWIGATMLLFYFLLIMPQKNGRKKTGYFATPWRPAIILLPSAALWARF